MVLRILPGPGGLLLMSLAVATGLFFLPRPMRAKASPKPSYDLIFGVHTYKPNFKPTVTISPYIRGGTLYITAEQHLPPEAPPSSCVTLYRYNSKTGIAEPLLSPDAQEVQSIQGTQTFAFGPTQHLKLYTHETSPDGFSLAEPGWVKVNPVSSVFGNIAMFLVAGSFGPLKKRENSPRLASASGSMPIKSAHPIFKDEADSAFFLAWIVPDSGKAGQDQTH
ncbi:hypothetical protein K3G63_14800 [Hymenobacter sp. HSC-4F20]|uniref:hypothetical protein n=1 Tax=Hymenobacter sp. HSC-4F20 TaxID=2864135 RepID=UPI001C737F5B|nr:hypothetical protein [Hymenobacter sp. HSC-4F20]MBX0291717.1 hypothetical protein [Hymenobacter sp. HSC-4F20]